VICGFLYHFDWITVGVAGFEPATSWSQTRRDTGLRYTPKRFAKLSFKIAAANILKENFIIFKVEG
jgi:hypothetical protein